ncbi:MAG: hypothetical protein Fur0041_05680 [Bacteroidia bacterium]
MKRILLVAALALPLFWTACKGEGGESKEDVVPKGMRAVDLTPKGFPIKINVPDSATGVLDTLDDPSGIEIKVGGKFDVLVNTAGPEEADIAKQKSLIDAADAGTNNYIINDATTLLWETKFGDLSMFHFYHIVKIGNDTYYVRDNNVNPENQFKKEEVEKMLESAKSLRAKPAPQAE